MPRKLRIEYRTEDSFRREYAQNIANGGIFLPTKHSLALRDPVEVELVLAFRNESVVLPGEVVHCIPAEMAATGASPGVAVQFSIPADEVRSKLEPFAGGSVPVDEPAPFHDWLIRQVGRNDVVGDLAGDYSAGVRECDHRVARTADELLAIFHEVSHSPEAYDAAVEGRHLLLCGDLNVAREERDVHPKERKPNQVGTRPAERDLLERLISRNLVDVGRALDPDNDNLFTWWAPWRNLRQRNIGWRIDYVLASAPLAATARSSSVQREVGTSDHGPVVVTLGDGGDQGTVP